MCMISLTHKHFTLNFGCDGSVGGQQQCWEYFTYSAQGQLVASIGGWLTGDGDDRRMTALAGNTAFGVGGIMMAKAGRTMMEKRGR